MKVGIVSVGDFPQSVLEACKDFYNCKFFMFENCALEEVMTFYVIQQKIPLTIFPLPYAESEGAFYQAQIIKLADVCDVVLLFAQVDCIHAQRCITYAKQAKLNVIRFEPVRRI